MIKLTYLKVGTASEAKKRVKQFVFMRSAIVQVKGKKFF